MAGDPSQSSRREFLKGRAAARAIVEATSAAADASPLPTPAVAARRSLLIQVSRTAMACEFEIVLNAGQHPGGADAAVAALDLVDRLEDQLTVYRDHSEVSQMNRLAADERVAVESRLFGLLEQAQQLSAETGGAFDITAGPLSKVWGFYRRQGQMPSQADVVQSLAAVGSVALELNAAERTVHFQRPNMEINLGAIGKGYALDRSGDLLLSEGVSDFLLHGGQSSVLASGSRLRDAPVDSAAREETGWTVGLRHPLKPSQRLAEFRLVDRALGTSGSGSQYFHHAGKRYGHILDPRTGWPADGVLSSTVIAPTAAEADALATALYVMGLEQARDFCSRHAEIAALLVTQGARAGAIELHPLNLPDDDWRRLE